MTRRGWAIALAAFLGRNLLRAGQNGPGPASSDTVARPRPAEEAPAPPPPPSESKGESKTAIRVDVALVNVLFSVRKKQGGELVPNLTKDDFTVLEDGKEQVVSQFSRETDLPMKLGLLIDVSRSQTRLMGDERDAASKFISSVLRPKDEAFLLSFGRDTTLEQDFTESAQTMEAALKRVKIDGGEQQGGGGRGGGGGGYPGGGGGGVGFPGGGVGFPGGGGGRRGGRGGQGQSGHHGGTKLYDAIYLASDEELSHKTGRKALLLITDGNDRGSHYTRGQAIEAAQRADAIIYSIYYADTGEQRFGQRGDESGAGLDGLKHMSNETGGRAFTVDKKHPLQQAFTDIQEEMRSQYAIAWKPVNPAQNGDYREIEVRPKNADYVVQARKGYYAGTGKSS
jgi:VWFA-related protein